MNTNPPNDTNTAGYTRLPMLINIQKRFGTGIVKTSTGKKFPVTLSPIVQKGAMLLDYVEIKKSAVTGEWIATNYFINIEVAQEIEDSYKTPCNYVEDDFCEDCQNPCEWEVEV